MIIGIICIVIEIIDPIFFFLSLGVAAILTGLFSLLVPSTPIQILFFVILSFIAFLSMRKLGKKLLKHSGDETNIYALKGKTGITTKDIPVDGKGYVKVGGEEWSAINPKNLLISEGTKVNIVGHEGNKLLVEPHKD
jgi:membrane protein implicated in regulation of membrane protease activity